MLCNISKIMVGATRLGGEKKGKNKEEREMKEERSRGRGNEERSPLVFSLLSV